MKFTVSLRKTGQFKAVYSKGRSRATETLVLYTLGNGLEKNRLGLSVSKKVGNAVTRNRIARLIRENYRLLEGNVKTGVDIVVIARKPASGADFYEIRDSLLRLLKKQSVYIANAIEKRD